MNEERMCRMNTYKFSSGHDMLDKIRETDLYSPTLGVYVFLYNEVGSIARYNIDVKEARLLETKVRESGEDYWGAFLGPGGVIYDDPSYETYEDYAMSNLDYCNEVFTYDWIATSDVLKDENMHLHQENRYEALFRFPKGYVYVQYLADDPEYDIDYTVYDLNFRDVDGGCFGEDGKFDLLGAAKESVGTEDLTPLDVDAYREQYPFL